MNSKDRRILLVTLTLITAIIAIDLVNDSMDGVVWWHILAEGTAGLLAIGGIFYLVKDSLRLRHDLTYAKDRETKLQAQADQWQSQAKAYLDGLSVLIADQLTTWSLTPAEREVAFLLLKGMSLKDISTLRGTTEKTARVQSMAIYAKAGLAGRSELSAFFLEELLPPQTAQDN